MSLARRLALWAFSLIVVVGLHTALYYAALLWRPAVTPPQLEATTMRVELEPLAPLPPTPPQSVVEPAPKPEAEPLRKVVEAPEPKLAIVKPKPQANPRSQPARLPKPEITPQAESAPRAASQQATASSRAPTPQPTSQGEIDRERALWMATLQAYLSQRLRYPERERRFNRPGSRHTLLLSFTINSRGHILASEVKQSTARSAFDRDVQRQLRKASPVPPPPKQVLASGSLSIDYPLSFTLTR